MSDLLAGLVGLFILLVFGLLFLGVPIAIIVFLLARNRKSRPPQQPRQQRQRGHGSSDFGNALERDDNFTHDMSGAAFSSAGESSSSWESGGSSSSSDW